jgi:flagellar basal body rod protein FlgG
MRSLDIAGTGMQAQQTNVEVISNPTFPLLRFQ